ncbi:hypothetical protein CSOJ01_06072 [Colletotrichum sojae]|uniref:Uncharacterized protein n=1 Tax=Colletotrichum sojae TaxID=2175907 RepID=A0A8H6MVT8_9PEZI|nr:hypothetical protein CSOJ01_06072 [Colletotrichum sojae]
MILAEPRACLTSRKKKPGADGSSSRRLSDQHYSIKVHGLAGTGNKTARHPAPASVPIGSITPGHGIHPTLSLRGSPGEGGTPGKITTGGAESRRCRRRLCPSRIREPTYTVHLGPWTFSGKHSQPCPHHGQTRRACEDDAGQLNICKIAQERGGARGLWRPGLPVRSPGCRAASYSPNTTTRWPQFTQ